MRGFLLVTLGCCGAFACGRLGFDLSVDSGSRQMDPDNEVPDGTLPGDDSPDSLNSPSFVVAGRSQSCGLSSGTLLCWGQNDEGQLGLGDNINRQSATVVDNNRWLDLAVGEDVTCALKEDRTAWCSGANDWGELGNGTSNSTSRLVQTLGEDWRHITAVFFHVCAIRKDATLWCWGDNTEGQLGQGDRNNTRSSPVQVGSATDWMDVAAGQGHTCGIRSPGTLWCWGRNTEGELGQGPNSPIQIRSPVQVGSTDDWVQVTSGQDHNCARRKSGELWCWGRGVAGQLGVGGNTSVDVPTRVGTDQDWAQVSVNTFHTCGVRDNGTLWCWGRNVEGQLGLPPTARLETPTRVGVDEDWRAVHLGRFHTCATKTDGSFFCTGNNGAGELGLDDSQRRSEFTRVVMP